MMAEKKNREKTLDKSKQAKWGKGLLWFAGSVFVLIIVLLLAVRFLLPNQKIKMFITGKVSGIIERDIWIDEVTVNPLGKIYLEGVGIGFSAEENRSGETFIKVDRLSVGFRLSSLIRRHLNVTGIYMEAPEIHIVSPPVGKTVQDTAPVSTDTTTVMPGDQSLPFSLGLMRFTLENFRFDLTLTDSTGETHLSLDNISLNVSNLRLPDDFLTDPGGIRGDVQLSVAGGEFHYGRDDTVIEALSDIHISGSWNKKGKWCLLSRFGLYPSRSQVENGVLLDFGMAGEGFGRIVEIEKADLSIGSQNLLHIRGGLKNLGPGMDADLIISGEGATLEKSRRILEALLPDEWFRPLDGIKAEGLFYPVTGQIAGSPEALRFSFESTLESGKMVFPSSGLDLTGGDLVLETRGTITPDGLNNGVAAGSITAESVSFTAADSLVFSADSMAMTWRTRLDSAWLPSEGFLKGGFGAVLGGQLNIDFHWTPDEITEAEIFGLIVDGNVLVDSLCLDRLPIAGMDLIGAVSADAGLKSDGFRTYDLNLTFNSDSVFFRTAETADVLPPVHVRAHISAATDSLFSEWMLNPSQLMLDSLAAFKLSGDFDGKTGKFRFALTDGMVRNRELIRFLPGSVKEQLKDPLLCGHEIIEIRLAGKAAADTTLLDIRGQVDFIDAGFAGTLFPVSATGIGGGLAFSGTPLQLRGKADVVIDSVESETYGIDLLTSNRLRFDWNLTPPGQVGVDDGILRLPDLGAESAFSFNLQENGDYPFLNGSAQLALQSTRRVTFLNGLSYAGSCGCVINGKTNGDHESWLDVSGQIKIDTLDFVLQDVVSLSQIRGNVPFDVVVDLSEGKLVQTRNPIDFDALDYENHRILYKKLFPRIGTLYSKTISFLDYQVDGLIMDLDVSGSTLRIPWFVLNGFEGNLGGSAEADLGDGSPENIFYEIRASASRINASSLTDIRLAGEEDMELNATMAFSGRGLDIEREMEINGFFHITKIGPRFASTLLRGMDPGGADRSIRMTRRLLDMGWKPKLFSFEMRHGYVYPSLQLSQPWFSPLRLPRQLDYGRLPLAFFLNKTGENLD